jgi:endo-alpha-1,4-polygalactosaminidase (GH114 family)
MIKTLLITISLIFLGCGDSSNQIPEKKTIEKKEEIVKSDMTNIAPVATFDKLDINRDIRYAGELTAIDADGDLLKYEIVTQPEHGSVVIYENGCFTYTPEQGYTGRDTFSYIARDEVSACAIKTVTVNVVAPTIQPPAAPTNLMITALSTTKLKLVWQDNSENEEGFVIYQNGQLVATTDENVSEKIICCGLIGGKSYDFEVKAKNLAGLSTAVKAVGKTKEITTAPAAPTNLEVKALADTMIRLVWHDNANNESAYEIYQDGVKIKSILPSCQCSVIDNLQAGKTYSFVVKAVNKIGVSSSNTISVITSQTTTQEGNITSQNIVKDSYIIHKKIRITTFWTGEEASSENANIPNLASAWDDMWMLNYGGVDTPDERNGYYPAGFKPTENPFYFALPYNDFDTNGKKRADIEKYIPWATPTDKADVSICKNRWIKIVKDNRTAYAQWEDVGPFGEKDSAYVFGDALPKNGLNNSAGLDVSPAVRDYLGLNGMDIVDWQFIDDKDVPQGPWREIVTTSNTNWVDWYKPDINASWQIQLNGDINTSYNVDIYDIDLFDSNYSVIQSLKERGKKVICYFSAGSYEEWREDKEAFSATLLGKDLYGWEGERWLDISQIELLRPIMIARLDMAKDKGCDGVDPDNVNGYIHETGFNLTADMQLAYNKMISNEARKRGLSVGLKNDLEQIDVLEPFYDFGVNEECHFYEECDLERPFTKANKPVFNIEYNQKYIDNNKSERDKMCQNAISLKIKTLVLPLDLDDSFHYSCD